MNEKSKILLLLLAGSFFFVSAACITAYDHIQPKKSHRQSAKKTKRLLPVTAENRLKESKWGERFQSISHNARTKRPDIVFLGDSITHGWRYTNTWNTQFGKYRPLNAGISSDRVQHLLWRVKNGNFSRIQPKIAVILIGINNLAFNKPQEIAGGIKQVTNEIRKRSPRTKILLLGVFPSGKSASHKRRGKIKTLNRHIKLVANGKKIHYLDIGKRFLQSDGSIAKSTMFDYLHLTHKGYRIWANAMNPTLRRLLSSH